MLLFEPPPSQGDLHFRVLGIPVRVHPMFWLTTIIFSLGGGGIPPLEFVIWVVVVFVSILIHELGHALVQRKFGGRPRITLHALGGLASSDDCDRRPRSQILISLAGPGAGFLLAALTAAVASFVGHSVGLYPEKGVPLANPQGFVIARYAIAWDAFASDVANLMMRDLLWVNIVWGLVNLLPVYPLDGGHVSRELCALGDPRRGIVLSLQISMVAAAAMVAFAIISWNSLYTAVMFGYMAFANLQTLRAYQGQRW